MMAQEPRKMEVEIFGKWNNKTVQMCCKFPEQTNKQPSEALQLFLEEKLPFHFYFAVLICAQQGKFLVYLLRSWDRSFWSYKQKGLAR